MPDERLRREFFAIPAAELAPALLGARLVRVLDDGARVSGVIVETEAYVGVKDRASHAFEGRRTARNEAMYADAGTAYVYFTYGMHWCLNAVTEAEDFPAAVLIRAVIPIEGIDQVRLRRPGIPERNWCDGPAKLCRAFDITGDLNGADLTRPGELWIEPGSEVSDKIVEKGPRVGISYAAEPWCSIPWRFKLRIVV